PKPWPVNRDRRVEVAEFFWYGCPACAAFEPVLKAWHAPKASAVVLRKLHPVANPGWLAAAQLHASLLTMGIANALSDRLYAAIQQQGAPLASQADAIELAASLGVDRAGIMSAWRAAQTRAHMDTAQQMARFFRVDGVPTLVVGGRWITSPKIAGGVKPLFRVLGQLVSLAGRSA
ncbi:MAG: thiol:disulfide interchange protein DsbA/DsbL, partial [Quisquiliibacterium sp.]